MAVVVQRMVDADVAGVLFTIDPTCGRRDRMLVEAVFGLGEAIVSGEVTPDHYVLARDGRLKRCRLATQPYSVTRDQAGGVCEAPLSEAAGSAQTFDEEQLRRLAEVGRDFEERLGSRRTSSGRSSGASSSSFRRAQSPRDYRADAIALEVRAPGSERNNGPVS